MINISADCSHIHGDIRLHHKQSLAADTSDCFGKIKIKNWQPLSKGPQPNARKFGPYNRVKKITGRTTTLRDSMAIYFLISSYFYKSLAMSRNS